MMYFHSDAMERLTKLQSIIKDDLSNSRLSNWNGRMWQFDIR